MKKQKVIKHKALKANSAFFNKHAPVISRERSDREISKKRSLTFVRNDIYSQINSILFFLFLFLLPTQFGKHFFFDFSYVSGVRSDYLAPTLYLTDLLVIILAVFNFKKVLGFFQNKNVLAGLFLLLLTVPFAQVPQIAIYRFFKIVELIFVFALFKEVYKDQKYLIPILASTIFQFMLVIWQFVSKHSVQGVFYFFGERYLTLSMPDIAKASLNGVEFLRPYGTFSHPNSLAGFFLLLYALFLYSTKHNSWLRNLFIAVSSILILLSFSKAAILVYLLVAFVYYLQKQESCRLCAISRILVVAVLSLVFFQAQSDPYSVEKRLVLVKNSISIFMAHPVFGVGLGNFVTAAKSLTSPYFLLPQPVHNIVLLWLAEGGIFAVAVLALVLFSFRENFRNKIFLACFLVVFLTGVADHYWLTLQQNFLLLGVVFGVLTNRRLKLL